MRDLRVVVMVKVLVTVLIFQLVTQTTANPTVNYEESQTESQTAFHSSSSIYSSSSSSTSFNSTFESSYLLVAPSFVRANMMFNIGVNLPKAPRACNLTAVIRTKSTLVAGGRGTFDSKQSGLLSIRVPEKIPKEYLYYLEIKSYGSLEFNVTYPLLYQWRKLSLFIQTDKPVYKASDKVQFRAFALYSNYKVYQDLLDIIIYDPDSNKVQQWLNDTHQLDGVVSGEFALPPKPRYGLWQIQVTTDDQSISKSFMVMEYVKPLFDVVINMPSYVLQSQEEVVFFIRARFSTGKPVEGRVQILASLINPNMTDDKIRNVKAFLDIELPFTRGQSQIAIPMNLIGRAANDLSKQVLFVVATVTEGMTGKMYWTNNTVEFQLAGEVLSFPIINAERFKPSLDYIVYLQLSQPDGKPLTRIKAEGVRVITKLHILDVDGPPPTPSPNQGDTLPSATIKDMEGVYKSIPIDGLIYFPIVPDKKAIAMEIRADYEGASSYLKVFASYSPSYSFIQVYLSRLANYVVGDIMEFVVKATENLEFYTYQVLAKGELLHSEKRYGYRSNTTKFYVNATAAMIPTVRIIVFFTRSDGEVVADSYHVEIQGNFPNEVQLSLDDRMVEPNKQIATYFIADGGGRMYLHAIDQRVYYKNSLSEISRDEIYNKLDEFDPVWYSHTGRLKMQYARYAASTSAKDAHSTFWTSGLITLSDHFLYNYDSPYEGKYVQPHEETTEECELEWGPTDSSIRDGGRLWTHFPESWLWTDIEVCANGEAIYFVKVPDTITTWVINGFSINKDTGFGMPFGSRNLRVLKTFFIVTNFPKYDIILGEEIALEVIVFNYMSMDQRVMVTLPQNYGFTSTSRDCNGVNYKTQQDQILFIDVRTGLSASVFFPIVPLITGTIDIHVRVQSATVADGTSEHIKVVAPGSALDYNIPVYIDLTGKEKEFRKSFNISLPSNVVQNSRFMKVSVFGDLLGPSIFGLSSLLSIPVGCGEQTMLGMATDLYMTEYLRYTNQLSGVIKEKAYELMVTGYQQELKFKHPDGSFSAFGTRDDSGSMWLTAFVARVFHQASYHIFIEQDVIRYAINWMVRYQYANGSFPERGRVIDKHVKSNSGTGPSLSAFVFLALIENEDLYDEATKSGRAFFAAKKKCLEYLESQAASQSDLYFLSMASFALQMADSKETKPLIDRLMTKAVRKGNHVYWHHPDSHKDTIGTWHKPNPATAVDVEMTSYILATIALQEDIHLGRKIFYWLLRHRNSKGGFYSTQDTVVAFMAMGLFAELVYIDDIDMKTTISTDTDEAFRFNIDKNNALTNQRRETNKIPFHVTVEASGMGLAVVEISIYFNIELEIEDTTFDLNVTTITETTYFIYMETCVSWLGDGDASGMAVMEIGIPTGFEPDRDSLPDLDILKKIEMEDQKLVLYFDEISKDPVCISLGQNRTGLVGKNKPVVIKVYDYYEPTNQMTYFYKSKLLAQVGICDVCHLCYNCIEKTKPGGKETPTTIDEDYAIENEISAG